MNRVRWGMSLCLLVFSMSGCSGPPRNGGGGGGGTAGNATVSLTLRATPPSPTANLSILAFRATVIGVSLTPSSGSAVNVGLISSSYVAEFTRLQSDSSLLSAVVTIPAETYNSVTVTFSDVSLAYCTQPSSGVAGCAGSVTKVTGSPGAGTVSSGAFPLTVTSNEKLGLAL